jgi:anti-sigma-K factor RskA
MSETGHEHWRDEIAAYLVGALDPGEAAELERHVAGCPDCQADLRHLRPAVDLLPESVERVEPPPRLRAEILGRARAEASHAAANPERQMPFSRRRWFTGWRPAAGLAAVALVVAALAGYAVRGGDSGDQTTTVVAGKAPAVTAQLEMEGESATMHLANVREMPEDRVLEAWVQRDGEVERAGDLFVPDDAGRATATIPDMDGVEAVMVTAEPEGGSEAPTSTPMVIVEMPA